MTDPTPARELNPVDLAALANAVEALERVSFAARLNQLMGQQFSVIGAYLPESLSALASKAASLGLRAAMRAALLSLGEAPANNRRAFHRVLAAASGAAGGALGLASLPLELPISTTIMLRAIADIARGEGENLSDPEVGLQCMEVFALSAPHRDAGGESIEGGYFALRGLFAKSITEAAAYIAQKSAAEEAAPILVRLMGQIAARFGVIVSQKAAAQAVPIIGAVSGAAINLAFTEHFQSLAKGHFTVRRLERAYPPALVREAYENIAREKGLRKPHLI